MKAQADTIAAISTAAGLGAIGLVRLSGSRAVAIADSLFEGKTLAKQASHTAHFGSFYSSPVADGGRQLLDEVVVTLFLAGKSFTGEETVEISAHGSPYILHQILQACVAAGARSALPGEFTQRAFLNGKMDLAQAEAVGDLIAAENKASHHIALNQMRGSVSTELAHLRDKLINFTALIELELDFGEEDVEFADRTALSHLVQELKSAIQKLIQSFEYGNALKNGVPVAIIGLPNAGKSTLLNALLQEERAIVSDIAGTTRDAIEETINIEGISFRFIDTAGIRQTDDVIEAIGVERAKQKVRQAFVVIHLYDQPDTLLEDLQEDLSNKIVFSLRSKADGATEAAPRLSVEERFHHFSISVKTGFQLELLKQALVLHFKHQQHQNAVVITNVRHKQALELAAEALEMVDREMAKQASGDLLSLYLKDALYHIGSITGKIDVDRDILGTIFGKFCIGK